MSLTGGGLPPPAQNTLPADIRPSQAGRFRTPCVTQKGQFLNHALFHLRRHQVPATQSRADRTQAFRVWAEVTGVTASA